MPTMLFKPFKPDLSDLGDVAFPDVQNCVPQENGYGPFKDLQSFTQALPANCRGYYFGRKSDGSIAVFAGTSTRLYQLDNTTFAWVDVSKGGVAYPALSAEFNWRFEQFGDFVIAVQANVPPQKFVLSSGTTFVDLAGSPPQAGGVAVVGFFLVLTQLLSNARRLQWSDLDAPETWNAGVGLADFQDLPDGGSTIGISGGDAYGLVFQEQSFRTMIYAPGSPVVFQINRISINEVLFARYSIVNVGDRTFYIGASGIKMVQSGGAPVDIGKEQVNRFFFNDVDKSNLQLCVGASDPTATRVYFAYKSQSGSAGLFDRILVYDWGFPSGGRWSLLIVSGEWLATLSKPGLTLEQLDAIALGGITITGAANNGSGLIRLTLSPGVSNPPFVITGQNFIVVQGVNPAYMNGTWRFNSVDATHIDLVGSAFAAAYVSGGRIGGSLDALGFSLDSISKAAVAQLSAVSSTNKVGFFDGSNLEAIMMTDEVDGEGQMLFTSGMRLLTDCASAVGNIGYRGNPSASLSFTEEAAIDETGWCPQLVESRYQRGRMRIPYGSSWSYAKGVQPDAQTAGER